jgi:hypothetical protein
MCPIVKARVCYWTTSDFAALALEPPLVQRTVTGQLPRVVRVLTVQLQDTVPLALAALGPRPAALDGPDLYCTTTVQAAPAAVFAPTVAVDPRLIGEVRLVIATVIAPLTGAVLGRGVAAGFAVAAGAEDGMESPTT